MMFLLHEPIAIGPMQIFRKEACLEVVTNWIWKAYNDLTITYMQYANIACALHMQNLVYGYTSKFYISTLVLT